MPEIVFLNGPHDGLTLSSGLGAPFLWTDGKRCFRAPARDRDLYKAVGVDSKGLKILRHRYHYAGHTHVLCECGVFRAKHHPCQLCGSAVGVT